MRNVKRFMFATTLVTMGMLSSVVAYASSGNRTEKFNRYNAYGSEFVSFVEGPLTISDKVSYSFDLIGTEKKYVSMEYEARTPSKLVSQGTLSASKGYSVEGTNKNGGYGNTYAQSSMSFNGVTYTITATD